MYARLEKFADQLRSSYWFIPALMALAAFALAIGLVALDDVLGDEWIENIPLFSGSRPDGARAILTAIGGSMIGVAGTVFSVTMVAVVYASGQYGPRLLTHFLTDRGNQFTLGTFTATFVYSIMVLRTIRSAGEDGSTFVPNFALLVCILLALCSIGVLIFFIHHVPTRIHISNVIAGIGRSLIDALGTRYPAYIGEPARRAEPDTVPGWQLPNCFRDDADQNEAEADYAEVESNVIGYVQFLNSTTLMTTAAAHDLVVRLNIRPGTYVFPGMIVFDVWPAERLDDLARDALLASIATGARRTPTDDMLFLIDELVEIVARALSPGVNDPSTANTCFDWMAAVLAELAVLETPDPLRVDADGKLRVVVSPPSFADFLRLTFGAVRDYAASDKSASRHFLYALGLVARRCEKQSRLDALEAEAGYLVELCRLRLDGHSLVEVETEAAIFESTLKHPRRRSPFPPLMNAGPEPVKDEKPKKRPVRRQRKPTAKPPSKARSKS